MTKFTKADYKKIKAMTLDFLYPVLEIIEKSKSKKNIALKLHDYLQTLTCAAFYVHMANKNIKSKMTKDEIKDLDKKTYKIYVELTKDLKD